MAVFLDEKPASDTLAGVKGHDREEIKLGTREIYVHYGDGIGHSRLKIPAAKDGTMRNINTVVKLAALAAM